jgi:hypothetical protein
MGEKLHASGMRTQQLTTVVICVEVPVYIAASDCARLPIIRCYPQDMCIVGAGGTPPRQPPGRRRYGNALSATVH